MWKGAKAFTLIGCVFTCPCSTFWFRCLSLFSPPVLTRYSIITFLQAPKHHHLHEKHAWKMAAVVIWSTETIPLHIALTAPLWTVCHSPKMKNFLQLISGDVWNFSLRSMQTSGENCKPITWAVNLIFLERWSGSVHHAAVQENEMQIFW